jgi:hypothetical protein
MAWFFFFQIQAANLNDIVSLTHTSVAAQITVESGDVSSHLLLSELARIIPVRWDWEVQELGHQCFVVPFPSKEELERMVAIRTITTKNKEGTLLFEEFVDDVQPIKVLDQVWVTVTKVPRVLRSFLPLWAVGTIIGATQKVDVYHLRQTGEVRILVAVLDVKKYQKLLMFVSKEYVPAFISSQMKWQLKLSTLMRMTCWEKMIKTWMVMVTGRWKMPMLIQNHKFLRRAKLLLRIAQCRCGFRGTCSTAVSCPGQYGRNQALTHRMQ